MILLQLLSLMQVEHLEFIRRKEEKKSDEISHDEGNIMMKKTSWWRVNSVGFIS